MAQIFEFIESYNNFALKVDTDPDSSLVTFEDKVTGKFCLKLTIDKKKLIIEPNDVLNANDMQLAGIINEKGKFNKISKILDLMEFIKDKISNVTNYCIGCYKKMEFQSAAYITCGDEQCNIKYEEMRIGNPVTDMVKDDPDLVRFLFDSAKDAITCDRKQFIFDPFPTYFLKHKIKIKKQRGKMDALSGDDHNDLKDYAKVTKVANKVKINKFLEAADISLDDQELIKEVGDDVYALMRFIILSCKVQLVPDKLMRNANSDKVMLDSNGKVIKEGALNCKAYKVIHPHYKNEEFTKLKGENGKSHFLFHGSRWQNWYSILRNGLKNCSHTKLMTAGAAYGNGIYLSDNSGLSYTYGSSGSRSVIGVFEVIGEKDRYKKNASVYVCPDETQLIQRYLLIIPSKGYSNAVADLDKIFNNDIYNEKVKTRTRVIKKGIKKLLKEYKAIIKQDSEKLGFRAELDPNNSYIWNIYIFGYDKESPIGKDMKNLGIKEIEMEVRFPDNYPFSPPFIRVVKPRFKYQTGHVTSAGALCMQVLTDKFWSPACSIESLIITIKSEILEGEGRLDYNKYNIPYTLSEAKSSFVRVAMGHQWM